MNDKVCSPREKERQGPTGENKRVDVGEDGSPTIVIKKE